MVKFEVGDKVEFVEDFCLSALKGSRGIVTRPTDYDGLTTVILTSGGSTTAFSSRMKLVETKTISPDTLFTVTKDTSKSQLRVIAQQIKRMINSEEIVLYSVTGRNWGKKKFPQSKLKMSYTITEGEVGKTTIVKL
jgi:hypothetical protein